MLRQELSSPEELDASQARVSAEELVRALAAIEERRLEEGQTDSIRLDDAIRQLQLDVTPDELLAEVTSQRSYAAERQDLRYRALLGVVLVFSILLGILLGHFTSRQEPMPLSPSPVAPVVAHAAALDNYPLLSEVPAGQYVQCDFATLRNLIQGESHGAVRTSGRTVPSEGLWQIKKTPGGLVVKCYASAENALKAANSGDVIVYNGPQYASWVFADTVIDLPLHRLRNAPPYHTEGPNGTEIIRGVRLFTADTHPEP